MGAVAARLACHRHRAGRECGRVGAEHPLADLRDTGPHLGCYGDATRRRPTSTPSPPGVALPPGLVDGARLCPRRTAIITGRYPSALGAEHMRSFVPLPAGTRLYPQLLREAGYYCSNNSKEDYNVAAPGLVWDESSPRAHWRNRQPGQPFFAIQLHRDPRERDPQAPPPVVHDLRAPVPPYMPDTGGSAGWAQY
jgi:uncharacterized sulfatase